MFTSRSKDIIEPIPKPQWYMKCDGMAKRAVEVSLSFLVNKRELISVVLSIARRV